MESTAPCPAVVSTVQLTRRSTARRVRKMLIPLGAMGFQASDTCGMNDQDAFQRSTSLAHIARLRK